MATKDVQPQFPNRYVNHNQDPPVPPAKKLAPGEMRVRFDVSLEGPVEDVAKQLGAIVQSFPPAEQKKIKREIEKKLRQKARQIRSK